MTGTTEPSGESRSQIAVVDDDPRIRHLLREELIDAGFDPECYKDGFALLEKLTITPPDLILLDLMMPQLDGIECLRRIRQAGFEGPVLIFTALSDNEKRQEAAFWIHHLADNSKPRTQYLPLLEMAASESPECFRTLFYLGREYTFHSKLAEAAPVFKKYLTLSTWPVERAEACLHLAKWR